MTPFTYRPAWTPARAVLLASAAVFVALWFILSIGLLKAPGVNRELGRAIILAALALGFGLFGWGMLLHRREPPPVVDETAIRPYADLISADRWRTLMVKAVAAVALAPFVEWSMAGFPARDTTRALPAMLFFFLLWRLTATVAGGRNSAGVDDELTASFRAEAWKTGFVTLLIGAAAAYIVSYDRTWFTVSLGAALPYALALGTAAMAGRFAWLERASAKDG